jgi:hypothetical protein
MKKLFQRFLLVGVFVLAQVWFLTAANASILLISDGPNLNLDSNGNLIDPSIMSKCALHTEQGIQLGTVTDTYPYFDASIGKVVITHTIQLNGASRYVAITDADLDTVMTHPMDEQMHKSFDQDDLTGANSMIFVEGNHHSNSPGVYNLPGITGGTGVFQNVSRILIRGAFSTFATDPTFTTDTTFKVIRSMGCCFLLE